MHKFSLKRLFQDTSLRSKVGIIFFVLLLIPLFCFTLYSTNRIEKVMREQTLIAAQKTYYEAYLSFQTLTKKMEDVSDTLMEEPLVMQSLSYDLDFHPLHKQFADYLDLRATFSQLMMLSGVDSISVYNDNPYFHRAINEVKHTKWYADLTTAPFRQWFTPADFVDAEQEKDAYFSYMRVLYPMENWGEHTGIFRVDISQTQFMRSLAETTVTPGSVMLFMTEEDIILSSKEYVLDQETLHAVIAADAKNDWSLLSVQGERHYVLCEKIVPSGWMLAILIPYSDIVATSSQLRLGMVCLMLGLASIAYLIAMALANSILKRIYKLSDATKEIQTDKFVPLKDTSQDEIGDLSRRFNEMVEKIDRLMDEKVQYGRDIKNLELKALQAQINPHFLYNTLDTINCLAIQKDAPEITKVVSSLASFYKLSLSKGREKILIRDELAHAKMYINIMNSRFPGQIQTIWDIAPGIENYSIIKIVLQPIIENAVIHGIFEKESGSGTLRIRGWEEGEDICISIADDGIGMTQEIIDTNFMPQSQVLTQTSGGYGIRNICDRIRIAYGQTYGLLCESKPGEGTKVTIRIPKIN